MADLYDRQKTLKLDIPESVMVIGVGGVGSWVAFNLALTGVKSLLLVDHDIVEATNLNRTPFRLGDVGKLKVEAMAEMLLERRSDISVMAYGKRVESIDLRLFPEFDVVCDCRDNVEGLDKALQSKVPIIGGYDGMVITIHVNPNPSSVWGEGETRYRTVPSWLVPPQLIANIITTYLTSKREGEEELIENLDVGHLLHKILGRRLKNDKEHNSSKKI